MRKVAIVAKAGTSALAPWLDPGWEIWGMPWVSYPRVDLLFDYHSQEWHDTLPADHDVKEWLVKMSVKYADIPTYCEATRVGAYRKGIEYPLQEVLKSVPVGYFENTIAYQLALAIHERVDEIGLYGIHMMGRREFEAERPSVLYLIGVAQGKGIKVTVAEGSPLFMSFWYHGRYGYGKRRQMPINSDYFQGGK